MRKIITCVLPFLLLGRSTGVEIDESVILEGLAPTHTDAEYRLPKTTDADSSDECALEEVRGSELCLCAGVEGNVVHADDTWCD